MRGCNIQMSYSQGQHVCKYSKVMLLAPYIRSKERGVAACNTERWYYWLHHQVLNLNDELHQVDGYCVIHVKGCIYNCFMQH